jgi:probable DNA metabolism protein
MTIYLCENSVEGILCGVYEAWTSRKGHANVKLKLFEEETTMELFCQYIEVPEDTAKANKVVEAIRTKISEEAYQTVYKAALSKDFERADRIYRFLIYGFHIGAQVIHMLQVQEVYDMFQMCRHLDNETHLLKGFVRFVDMKGELLVGKIGPKNDVLVFFGPSFFGSAVWGKLGFI